jgi:hypothetical protein
MEQCSYEHVPRQEIDSVFSFPSPYSERLRSKIMRYLIIGLSLAQLALPIIMIINLFAMPKGYEIPVPSWVYMIVTLGLPIACLVRLRRKSEISGYRVSRW